MYSFGAIPSLLDVILCVYVYYSACLNYACFQVRICLIKHNIYK